MRNLIECQLIFNQPHHMLLCMQIIRKVEFLGKHFSPICATSISLSPSIIHQLRPSVMPLELLFS
jgi:hypothetical protein